MMSGFVGRWSQKLYLYIINSHQGEYNSGGDTQRVDSFGVEVGEKI